MTKFKIRLVLALLIGISPTVFGKYVYDYKSGNSYNVNKIGNSTYVQGNNLGTGSSWSQTSTKVGNSTITHGVDKDGNSWNSTSTKIGNTVHTSGFNSDGSSFSSIEPVRL